MIQTLFILFFIALFLCLYLAYLSERIELHAASIFTIQCGADLKLEIGDSVCFPNGTYGKILDISDSKLITIKADVL